MGKVFKTPNNFDFCIFSQIYYKFFQELFQHSATWVHGAPDGNYNLHLYKGT